MKPPPFSYVRAYEVEEVAELLHHHGGEAKVLAGGQSLLPLLNLRLVRPSALVDINNVSGLDEVKFMDGRFRLGALVRLSQLQQSQVALESLPLLMEAMRHVGHSQIRNRGTVGGSAAHADPAAELPACLVTLDAVFRLRSRRGERTLGWVDFFRGPLTTALAEDEFLTEIDVALPPHDTGQAFVEFSRRHGDFALGGAAAVVGVDRNGICTTAALGLLAAGETPVRAHAAEALLLGAHVDEAAAREAAEEAVRDLAPPQDVHGSTEFRRRVNRELVKRAVLTAAARAHGSTAP